MIIPITLPPKSSPSPNCGEALPSPALPTALAQLGSSEYFLLELQGELEVTGDKHGQLVGRLTVDDDGKGKPTLRIGHHLLEGKIANLPKPLAILQRRTCVPPLAPTPPTTNSNTNSHDLPVNKNGSDIDIDGDGDIHMQQNDDISESKDGETNNNATSYAIRALVRKKIIFSKRPTPMVGLSASTSAAAIAKAT